MAKRISGAGLKVAIIERGRFGGTCVNTGCIPTKTLVASAYAAHMARRAVEYGVALHGPVSVNMKQVKARKDLISGQSSTGVETWLRKMANCTVLQGHARFESEREVTVGDVRIAAERIFINVGGRAAVPEIPGLAEIKYLTNSSMMEIDFLPRHLIIVGGGYVALEFAQMYRRFGSEVTILQSAPRVIANEDEDVSSAVRGILENEGIEIRVNADCKRVKKSDDGVIVSIGCDGKFTEVHGSHLLLAAGRRPNTDDLGLERAGIHSDSRGYITVNDELMTNVPGIWALGDCNGRGAFTHTSYNDFEIVAANLFENDHLRVSDRIMAYALYIDPPLGRAGMTEEQARKSTGQIMVAQRPMTSCEKTPSRAEIGRASCRERV